MVNTEARRARPCGTAGNTRGSPAWPLIPSTGGRGMQHMKSLKHSLAGPRAGALHSVAQGPHRSRGPATAGLADSGPARKAMAGGAETQLVLFAAGRKASNLAMAVLGSQPKGFLASRQALYLADMSKMPGFITPHVRPAFAARTAVSGGCFARTKRPWPTGLGQADAVTLIRLAQGRVVSQEFATSEAQLRSGAGFVDPDHFRRLCHGRVSKSLPRERFSLLRLWQQQFARPPDQDGPGRATRPLRASNPSLSIRQCPASPTAA